MVRGGRADGGRPAHRTAIVHTLTVDVPFDQISLFEMQRRRVMIVSCDDVLVRVKRTRKKNETWRTKGGSFETSNLCELRACPNNAGSKLNPASAQGKPPLCIIICCLIGSDICFCSSPGPSPNNFPNKPNIQPCCLSGSPSPNNFPNKPNIPPC